MEKPLNTLVYKRTHRGDPDESGVFGIHDCMGRVRRWAFEAAVGVGGKKPDRGHEDIANKINWIGIRPFKKEAGGKGPRVEFEHFLLLEEDGPHIRDLAPKLYRHMFEDQHVRAVLSRSLPREMQDEIRGILRLAGENNHTRKSRRSPEERFPQRRRC